MKPKRTGKRAMRRFGAALTVAALSLGVGIFALVKLLFPRVAIWADGRELIFGVAVIVAVLIAFGAAMLAARIRNRRGATAISGIAS